uniref:Uncharacterized protein n=1 Tax=viral metagenome TaxID=1070528 RepID=A0A6C0BC82_9ZZZZ
MEPLIAAPRSLSLDFKIHSSSYVNSHLRIFPLSCDDIYIHKIKTRTNSFKHHKVNQIPLVGLFLPSQRILNFRNMFSKNHSNEDGIESSCKSNPSKLR